MGSTLSDDIERWAGPGPIGGVIESGDHVVEQRPLAHPVPVPFSLIDSIIAYESGELDDDAALVLFGHLVKSGKAWELQGLYGRVADQLIKQGLISPEGEVL